MSRVFIVHGWGGSPEKDWMPWAKNELTKLGYLVSVPKMPDSQNPKIIPWINKLSSEVGKTQPDDIFIGHSIGTLAIIRYLETLVEGSKVNKVILIAPWHYLTLDEEENPEVAKPWQTQNVNYQKVITKANKFFTVFSKDDPWVPFQKNLEYFKQNLNPEIIEKDGCGHFTKDEGFAELPLIIDLIK